MNNIDKIFNDIKKTSNWSKTSRLMKHVPKNKNKTFSPKKSHLKQLCGPRTPPPQEFRAARYPSHARSTPSHPIPPPHPPVSYGMYPSPWPIPVAMPHFHPAPPGYRYPNPAGQLNEIALIPPPPPPPLPAKGIPERSSSPVPPPPPPLHPTKRNLKRSGGEGEECIGKRFHRIFE